MRRTPCGCNLSLSTLDTFLQYENISQPRHCTPDAVRRGDLPEPSLQKMQGAWQIAAVLENSDCEKTVLQKKLRKND
ncbi:MAG: hypothetical protein IJG45_08820 [Oscillospiraceae bacterium]|nr:hypothetical protein [Oscillospiraceae bacterium]